ncbi:hypothetical protein H310_03776 [Aphanomyces invadans]|uniref:AB hydrolase-1 domain-containing protein n=1 Tax=Aphanomyces invadans TaxID=157072 RepID=A0A024UEB2_9STRA|nr:hypothetical protein H310_03776 [Aphanomyces invadans]ETW04545.1 hypothetical protein H310_03776 [Aphanomyces invadans]|eukprot:XP_008865983.1 hypothetical protein H310_03776 [Aphanomyces invadans]
MATMAVVLARRSQRLVCLHTASTWMFRRRASTFATPTHHEYHVANGAVVHYSTYGPIDAAASIVLLHGAPGSYADFKHLSPLLAREHLNVVAFDLPGNGRSSADAVGSKYNLSDQSLAAAIVDALANRSDPNTMFILGHSFGSHTAMRVAANAKSVGGIALLAPVGLRPHHPLRRFPMVLLGRLLQQPHPLRSILAKINQLYYIHGLRFPKRVPQDDFTFALQRIGSCDFEHMKTVVETLHARNLPSFVAMACDDRLIEPEIIRELGHALPPGRRIEFQTGGHNIQKSQAREVANGLVQWIDSILARLSQHPPST